MSKAEKLRERLETVTWKSHEEMTTVIAAAIVEELGITEKVVQQLQRTVRSGLCWELDQREGPKHYVRTADALATLLEVAHGQ